MECKKNTLLLNFQSVKVKIIFSLNHQSVDKINECLFSFHTFNNFYVIQKYLLFIS